MGTACARATDVANVRVKDVVVKPRLEWTLRDAIRATADIFNGDNVRAQRDVCAQRRQER